MADITNPFPTDKQLRLIAQQIRDLTTANAPARLPKIRCAECRNLGQYYLFDRGSHLGILCLHCSSERPFKSLGLNWLRNSPIGKLQP